MFKNLVSKLFSKPKVRQDLKLVSYSEAEELLKSGYTLAKEEDTNHVFGMVYLELLGDKKPITEIIVVQNQHKNKKKLFEKIIVLVLWDL